MLVGLRMWFGLASIFLWGCFSAIAGWLFSWGDLRCYATPWINLAFGLRAVRGRRVLLVSFAHPLWVFKWKPAHSVFASNGNPRMHRCLLVWVVCNATGLVCCWFCCFRISEQLGYCSDSFCSRVARGIISAVVYWSKWLLALIRSSPSQVKGRMAVGALLLSSRCLVCQGSYPVVLKGLSVFVWVNP